MKKITEFEILSYDSENQSSRLVSFFNEFPYCIVEFQKEIIILIRNEKRFYCYIFDDSVREAEIDKELISSAEGVIQMIKNCIVNGMKMKECFFVENNSEEFTDFLSTYKIEAEWLLNKILKT